jgi:hypothetical protein
LFNTLNLKWELSVEELTDPKCRIAEFLDGTTKTKSAQELQVKDQDIIALIEQMARMLEELWLSTQSHRWVLPAEVPMDLRCKTAESPDGTTKTQSVLERPERDQVTTVLTELRERMLVDHLLKRLLPHNQFVMELTDTQVLTASPDQSAKDSQMRSRERLAELQVHPLLPETRSLTLSRSTTSPLALIEMQLIVSQPALNL